MGHRKQDAEAQVSSSIQLRKQPHLKIQTVPEKVTVYAELNRISLGFLIRLTGPLMVCWFGFFLH